MNRYYRNVSIFITLSLFINETFAASFGNITSDNVQDSATVCLAVGVWANLTGLDNFELENKGSDGQAGSVYEGSDSFHLESNHPVRVMVEGGTLSNGEDSIYTTYAIDDEFTMYNTPGESAHDGNHELKATARLGRISDQRAGDYSGVVTLTVVPQIGGAGGCGNFTSRFNSEDGWATLAYEDLYPNIGDGDYNDMVVRYSVEENYNANQELETITLQFDPLARGAGYNHSLSLSLDGELDKSKNVTTTTNPAFVGDALISVNYSDGENYDRTFHNYDVEDDITIFSSTRAVLDGYANVYDGQEITEPKFMTTVNITLANPELNLWSDRGSDSLLWFRPFLNVNNTNNDIDLAVINSDDGMIDSEGNPFGLFVPFDFSWPLERVGIDEAYPAFDEFKDMLTDPEQINDYAEQVFATPGDYDLIFDDGE